MAVTQEPQELEVAETIGDLTLFLPAEYEVKQLKATLGGITVDIGQDSSLHGAKIGDEIDLVIRGAVVTGAKPTHKGEVTLILHGTEIERA